MRQPHASSVSGVISAAVAAPIPEPSRMPMVVPQHVTAPMNPRRPSEACSTRKTIELVYSPPTDSPWIMRRITRITGAANPSRS